MKVRVPLMLAVGSLATALLLTAYAVGRGGARHASAALTMADVDLRVAPLEAHLTSARAELVAAQETIAVLKESVAGLEALVRHGLADVTVGGEAAQGALVSEARSAGTRQSAVTPRAARTTRTP